MGRMKKINGNQVKVTKAGYVYVDGKKVADKIAAPFHLGWLDGLVTDDQRDYVSKIIMGRYVMC